MFQRIPDPADSFSDSLGAVSEPFAGSIDGFRHPSGINLETGAGIRFRIVSGSNWNHFAMKLGSLAAYKDFSPPGSSPGSLQGFFWGDVFLGIKVNKSN